MPSEEIKSALESLNAELENTDAASEESAQHMDKLQADVNQSIEKINDREHHATLGDRLEQAFELFDADYPIVAQRIREVVVALSNAGL